MNLEAKRELARAVLDAFRVREESYVPGDAMNGGHYGLSYDQAYRTLDTYDADLEDAVRLLLVWPNDACEWAQRMLADLPAPYAQQVADGLIGQLEGYHLASGRNADGSEKMSELAD